MNFMAIIRLSVRALLRNRARSILTMLGVIIGVAAVIVTIAIGVGARISVSQQINSLGSNMLIVMPGSVSTSGARSGNGGASTLTADDGMAIASLPGVASVSPVVTVRTQAIAGNNNWQTTVTGVAPTYTFVRGWSVATGTFFTQSDVASTAKVAVLGQTVVQNLFPNVSNPIGQTILIKGVPFTVIGTMSARGQSSVGQDQDDVILTPYTSAMQRLIGTTYVSQMYVSAADSDQMSTVQNEVTTLLEQRHRIQPGQSDDFQVRNLQDIAAAASATSAVMEYLLAGVAGVSLLVGGIGIMNIMLVSVTERTREIGLRIAVGAPGSAILWQFLAEAIVLSTVGGLIGVVAGAAGTVLVAAIGHWPMVVPPAAVGLAVAFSAIVGVFFGYYPASKAARLDPIVALRFE